MKLRHFIFFIPFLFTLTAPGQNDQTIQLRNLYNNEKYDEVIKYKAKKGEELSAKSLYYIGMSYFMKSNDAKALKYLNLALTKGPVDHDMFYYKGVTLFYMEKYKESLPCFDSAIRRLPNEPDFYTGKGESYYALHNIDSAIFYFEKGSVYPNCKPRFYMLMGEIYQTQKRNSEALKVYKIAVSKISSGNEFYQNCFYNIGLLQQLTGDNTGAKETFEKYRARYSNDYHAIAKLIQVYYSLGMYEDARPLKDKLYDAHRKKKLTEDMKVMFCFDQFTWNGKKIMVFENFDEPDDFLFVKHIFYILKDNGDIDYLVRSESSVAVRMTPGNKYVLCLVRNNSYSTYWNFIFNDDYKYPDLKKAVLDILNGNVKPGGTTTNGR